MWEYPVMGRTGCSKHRRCVSILRCWFQSASRRLKCLAFMTTPKPGFEKRKPSRGRDESSPAPSAEHVSPSIARHGSGRSLPPRRAGFGGSGIGAGRGRRAAPGAARRGRSRIVCRAGKGFPGRVMPHYAAHATEPWQNMDAVQMLEAEEPWVQRSCGRTSPKTAGSPRAAISWRNSTCESRDGDSGRPTRHWAQGCRETAGQL